MSDAGADAVRGCSAFGCEGRTPQQKSRFQVNYNDTFVSVHNTSIYIGIFLIWHEHDVLGNSLGKR